MSVLSNSLIPFLSYSLTFLIPSAFLLVFLYKLTNWIYLTLWTPKELDFSAYGSRPKNSARTPKAWALITGSSDGIGAAFAKELAGQRFNLFLVGRNMEKLESVKNEIISKCNNDVKVVCLISEASDASNKNILSLFERIDSVLAPLSGHSLRILINNVGMGQNGKRRLGDIGITEGEGGLFEEIVNVNCVYPVLLTRAFLQRLKPVRCAVINVASCTALTPATPFSSLYAATKAFNRSFSLSLSGEMSAKRLLHPETTPECDVICVNPGFVASNMTKMTKSAVCCTADEHSHIVFSKITRSWPLCTVDIIPHWKHGLMWSVLAFMETLIPSEWFLVAVIMPTVLKLSGKFRNFEIKE